MRVDKIGNRASGDPLLCLKETLQRRVAYLRQHGALNDTPVARFKTPMGCCTNVRPTMITAHLKATVKFLAGTHMGFTHKDVSAWSLTAAGAMALLYSGVDTHIISLIGHWRSNGIMRYLHVQDETIMRNYSKLMIKHGNYKLLPHNAVPVY